MRNRWYFADIGSVLSRRPNAVAIMKGSDKYPEIKGRVLFHQMNDGVLVRAEIIGLPKGNGECKSPVFAFHLHEGKKCSGTELDPFADVGEHFNPELYPHPYHAVDMPPLFGANGKAFAMFLTERFKVTEIIGRTVIIHAMPDDFETQPSGDAGEKIACGVVMPMMRAN